MTDTALRLKTELARLPEQDRAALASFLIDTLDTEMDIDADAAWEVELGRREEEIRSGKAVGEPAPKVFAELREKHS
jgi:putative addiction module component (TIGR02574 family)